MGIKSTIIRMYYFPMDILNKIHMHFRGYKYGENLRTYGNVFIRGKGKVFIGDNVIINSSMGANPIGGASKTILFSKKGSKISIGNHVGISNTAIVSLSSIIIEDDVLIGGNCKIYDHDFHSLDYHTRILPGCIGVMAKPIIIKQGAFIGGHSIILKGVIIGRHSIVGAGSVVTKSIPDGEIWAGNPAVFIRKIEG